MFVVYTGTDGGSDGSRGKQLRAAGVDEFDNHRAQA
jgi:hypothetical protein